MKHVWWLHPRKWYFSSSWPQRIVCSSPTNWKSLTPILRFQVIQQVHIQHCPSICLPLHSRLATELDSLPTGLLVATMHRGIIFQMTELKMVSERGPTNPTTYRDSLHFFPQGTTFYCSLLANPESRRFTARSPDLNFACFKVWGQCDYSMARERTLNMLSDTPLFFSRSASLAV